MLSYTSNYEVPPLGRHDLRAYAKSIRKDLGLLDSPYFPVVSVLEALQLLTGISYDVIDDAEWIRGFGNDKQAEYSLTDKIIRIRQSVYDGAANDQGRDRFTLAHEIAHVLLLDDHNIRVAKKRAGKSIPLYRNPEWQADCLAGELLIPYHLCKDMYVDEIMEACKVSCDSARYQKSKF